MLVTTEKSGEEPAWPLPAIDVIRGLAALGVAVAHFGQQEVDLKSYGPLGMFMYQLGTWGVTIFFLLSGLCIHGATLVSKKKGHVICWNTFLKRRFYRIYPAFVFSLVAAGLASMFYSTELLKNPSISAALKHLFLISNFDAVDRCSLNGVLWSVVMECHFYILYPVYLWLIRTFGEGRGFLIVFLMGWVYFLSVSYFTNPGELRVALQFTFPALWWKLCLGALLAKIYFEGSPAFDKFYISKRLVVILFAASFVTCVIPNSTLVLWFQRVLLPFIMAAILLAVAYRGKSFLNIRSLRFVGLISYSIYLFHAITLAPFSKYTSGAWFPDLIVFLVLSLIVGAFGYIFVEKPFMARKLRG